MRIETYERVKRGMDVGLVLVFSPLVLAVILGCVLLVKLDSPGPVFFVQSRTGRGGRRFRMYKLRTMFRNADELKTKYIISTSWPGPISRSPTIRASPVPGASCARPAWTSCRRCSTC
jgi:lipopolysaccharide/colanic/teichoic acid biosynthesis glycosyltransferase